MFWSKSHGREWGDAVGSTSDFGPRGPWMDSRLRRREQVTFPQLSVYSAHMYLNSCNKSSTELMLVVEI